LEHHQVNPGGGHQHRSVHEAIDLPNPAQNGGPFNVSITHAGLERLGVRRAIAIRD